MSIQVRHVVATAGPSDGSVSVDRPSAIMYELGGRRYPMRSEPQCRVCQSLDYRQEIENALLRGFSYATIHRSLPSSSGLSRENIQEHVNAQHLPLNEAMRRVVMEESARDRGISIEDHEGSIVDYIGFAKLGVQRVIERMASGEIEPDIKDGIALANLLLRVQEVAGEGVDNEVMVQAFMVYMEALRRVCAPEQIKEIGAIIASNPVMAGLMNRTAAIPATSSNGSG